MAVVAVAFVGGSGGEDLLCWIVAVGVLANEDIISTADGHITEVKTIRMAMN